MTRPPVARFISARPQTLLGFWALLALLVLLSGLAPRRAAAAGFTATLDRDTITLGQSATLSLSFEGGVPQNAPVPSLPNVRVADAGWSQSMSADLTSGRSVTTLTHNFSLTPGQIGEVTIPPLSVEIGGQKLTSPPLKLKVVQPGSAVASGSGEQLAILKLALPKTEAYVGETLTGELQLYLHRAVQGVQAFQLTGFPADGFNVGKMIESSRRQVQFGSLLYNVIPIAFSFTPVRTGSLKVGPVSVSLIVELPSPNRRRSPFDMFDMFGAGEQREVTLAAEPVSLSVLALPTQDAPPDFKGAVGSYSMTVTAGPTNVAAGDPITLRVQITGRGALDALALPDPGDAANFKAYPPTAKVETTDPLGIQGTKTFEQMLVPQHDQIKTLPRIAFSFFDPDRKQYRTLSEQPLAITVRAAGSAAVPVVAAAAHPPADAPPSQDIIPIKQHLGTAAGIGPVLLRQPWFLALQSAPALAFLCAIMWRRRNELLARNPRLRRQRRVDRVVRAGLVALKSAAAEKRSDEFFATLFHLLQEQIGERLDLPSSAITESVLESHLQPREVPEPVLRELHDLFQACNIARYAPTQTREELAACIPRIEMALQQLREWKP